jgi:hypothetical protein
MVVGVKVNEALIGGVVGGRLRGASQPMIRPCPSPEQIRPPVSRAPLWNSKNIVSAGTSVAGESELLPQENHRPVLWLGFAMRCRPHKLADSQVRWCKPFR